MYPKVLTGGKNHASAWNSLVLFLTVLYTLSLAAVYYHSLPTVLPWRFIISLLLVVIPFAYLVAHGLFSIQRLNGSRWDSILVLVYPVVGLSLTWIFSVIYEATLGMLVLILFLWQGWSTYRNLQAGFVPSVCKSFAVMVLGYGTVWNLNSVLGLLTADRLKDPLLMQFDQAVYRLISSEVLDYHGIFPLVRHEFLFELLEGAYQMLFAEIFVVVFVLVAKQKDLARFFWVVFLTYLCGLIIFFVFPVVGPCIYYPESFHADYYSTQTHRLMQSMMAKHRAVIGESAGGGLAYFVGVPSLHVAMALIFQVYLSASRVHFWCFLPVNILLSLSTVLLGYHYLLDFVTGLLLSFVVIYFGYVKSDET